MALKLPPGFSTDFSGREAACIGIFGKEGTGKTRLAATAQEWADSRGFVPAWIIMDRKTRKTVRDVYTEMGWGAPIANKEDFVSQKNALKLATTDDLNLVKSAYTEAFQKVLDAATALAVDPTVNPIIFDSGSQLWDWIAYAHFGRKQDAGKSRVWGAPKQDWTDLFDALSSKTVIITLRAKDEYSNDARTGRDTWDGPPHMGYTSSTIVSLIQEKRPLVTGETFIDRFKLNIVQSQDNKGAEGREGVLVGEMITFFNLLGMLRPDECQ